MLPQYIILSTETNTNMFTNNLPVSTLLLLGRSIDKPIDVIFSTRQSSDQCKLSDFCFKVDLI